MANLIRTLREDWHPMRALYLIISAMLLVQAVQSRDWTFGMLGCLFLYQSIFNAGCCGMNGVIRRGVRDARQESLEDIEYTEVK